jgi:hypothetical protein
MPARAPRRATRRLAPAVLVALVLAAMLAGCGIIPGTASASAPLAGTGDVQVETRQLAPFTRVSVGAGLKVIIGAAAEQAVSLSAQGNLLPAIRTDVVDGQLVVTIPSPGVTTTQPMSLTLGMPVLESLALSAGSVGYVEFTGGNLNLDVSGGAELTAIGDTPDLRLVASSGSNAKLGELKAQNAEVTIREGSTAEVNVVAKVSGTAEGGSTLILTTKPATVDVVASSGATVQGG